MNPNSVKTIEIKTDLSGEIELEFKIDNSIFQKGFAKIAAGFATLHKVKRENLKTILDLSTCEFKEGINMLPYFPLNSIDHFIEGKNNIAKKYPLHTIVLKGSNKEKILYCFIELFSTFKFVIIINDSYNGNDVYHYYAYDLLNSKRIEARDYIKSLDTTLTFSDNCLYNYSLSQLTEMNQYAQSKESSLKMMNNQWFKELESFITFLNIEKKFKIH